MSVLTYSVQGRKRGAGSRPRPPSQIDDALARRIRLRRRDMGMSQRALGAAVGVTFQQIQKYENGSNRIGAGRLYDIARALGVPVQFFYDGSSERGPASGAGEGAPAAVARFLASRDAIDLLKVFLLIEDATARRQVVRFVESVARLEAKA